MIHSLAGGDIKKLRSSDFAKVELLEGASKGGIFWYRLSIAAVKVGDIVLVPFGRLDALVKARVLRIDRAVNQQVSPVPFSHAKSVYSRLGAIDNGED